MKIRLGSILNDLNITLDTAIERLKKAGIKNARKDFTLNTVVSEEEIQILSTNPHKERNNSKGHKKNKIKKDNKQSQKPIGIKKIMTSSQSFPSCASSFFKNQSQIDIFPVIKNELKRVFGNEASISKLPLFKTKVIKGINIQYKYHYFGLNGRMTLIKHRCVATWLASIFSEAVNQEKISKADYRQIYKTFLWKPIQSLKKKSVMPNKRPWVSVVSVPFGGMNRR